MLVKDQRIINKKKSANCIDLIANNCLINLALKLYSNKATD